MRGSGYILDLITMRRGFLPRSGFVQQGVIALEMGAFFLSRKDIGDEERKKAIKSTFERQGFSQIVDLSSRQQILLYCRKINVSEDSYYRLDDSNFCVVTGTLIYKKMIGVSAAKQLFEDFSAQQFDSNELYGNFAIVISLRSEIRIYTDTQGVYNLWHTTELTTISSSFLAVASCLGTLTVNTAGVYEYVFQEATFGGDTVFNEVRRLKVKQALLLNDTSSLIEPLPTDRNCDPGGDLQQYLLVSQNSLAKQFEAVSSCFADHVDSALSGGYDSRLLLGLCRQHRIEPHLHVYGSENDADVVVAKAICNGEGIALSHEDKSAFPKVTPEQIGPIVEKNFYSFQGHCPDGIVDNGSDLATRHQRTRNGFLLLNGGGGEVFRNFFYLPDKKYTILEFLWSFYSRFDPTLCTERFSENSYYQGLENKINDLLSISGGKLFREQIEYLYAGFRCTYWMGINNSINNQFGWFLTPFVDEQNAFPAQYIPIKYKNYGYFQAKLINHVDPALARYPSDYGHDFSGSIPFKRKLIDLATLLRPTLLRKYTYRLKKQNKQCWAYYLSALYLAEILPQGFVFMPVFFVMERISDESQFRRIVTLEYLFQKLNATLDNPQ